MFSFFGGPVKKREVSTGARQRIRSINIGTYILCILAFIAIVGSSTLEQLRNIDFDHQQLIENHRNVYDSHYRSYLDNKLEIVRKAIKVGYEAAEDQGAEVADQIVADVMYAYPDDNKLRQDLDNITSPEATKLTEIISKAVTGRYILDINNDNNDPFVAIRGSIVSDLSFNCSAYGRTRTFDQEVTMHFNPKVAKAALDNISNQSGDRNIWVFLPVPEYEVFYKDIKDLEVINEKILETLYYKHDGNIEIYKYPEFIYSNYIYRKKDVANRPLVDSRGIRQDDSQILIINNGFNVYDVIQMSGLKSDIDRLDKSIRNEKIAMDQFIEAQQLVLEKNKSLVLIRFLLLAGTSLLLVTFMAEYNNRQLKRYPENMESMDDNV